MKHLKIGSFSKIVAALLVIAFMSVSLNTYISVRNAKTIEVTWSEFQKVTAQKTLLLSQIRSLLGFNGMIHHFKNYVLRQERWRMLYVHKSILELNVAISAYRSLGVDLEEDRALTQLALIINQYKNTAILAEKLSDQNRLADEIDQSVRISDKSAIIALDTLERNLFKQYRDNVENVSTSVTQISNFSTFAGGGVFVLLAMVSGLILWFHHYRLVLPLQQLVKSFKKVNPHDPGSIRLPIEKSWGETELVSMAKTGNRYIDAVREHMRSRQRTQAELHDNEEHLRTIVDNAVEAIVTITEDGMITSFNQAASTLFLYPEKDVVGKPVTTLMTERDRAHHHAYVKNYMDTDTSKVIGTSRELLAQRRDGTVFPIQLGLSKTTTSKGIFFTGLIRDLSQRKETEMRLQLAKDAAEKANKAKSEFLASMSHELRTPMNSISGFTQLLLASQAHPPNDTQRQHLEHILQSGNHLLELIDQVLDLNKIEAGHMDVIMMDVDPKLIVEECIHSLQPKAQQTNITLENRCVEDMPARVYTDRLRLKQILYNLVSNAIKYNTPNGLVYLDSRLTQDDRLRICVHDTGLGIPAHQQKDIFAPFNRLGRENGDIEGTGIGLTITQKISESIRADIGFHSIEGEGSDFWVDIPLDMMQIEKM